LIFSKSYVPTAFLQLCGEAKEALAAAIAPIAMEILLQKG
jgi:hypothetical protein